MTFHHRMQTQNFRTTEAPLRGSFYSFLLRPRFQYLDVGDLLEYVMEKLWVLTGVRTNRVDFTLVNVCSPFTRMSFGSCSEPPEAAWPTGPALILTFATSQMQDYDLNPNYRTKITDQHIRIHDNNTIQWSPERGRVDFVSVSVGLQSAHDLTLQQPKINELEYIYNLIGPATKSIIRNQPKFMPPGQPYDDVHEGLNLKAVHDRVYSLPVAQLFTQIPYHLWAFSGELWRRAPNLIPMRLITPSVALYYFMYLRQDIQLISRASQDSGLRRLGLLSGKKMGVLGHLISSVLSLRQLIKTRETGFLTRSETLAPAVLAALINTEDATLSSNMNQLEEDVRILVEAFALSTTDVAELLSPPEDVARALIGEDREYLDTVFALLNKTY